MLTDEQARLLCKAVVNQAILDYQKLSRRGCESAVERGITYSRREITDFFRSPYGRAMLAEADRVD